MRNVSLLLVCGIPGTVRISIFVDDLLHHTAPGRSCDYPHFEGEESRAQSELLLFKSRSAVSFSTVFMCLKTHVVIFSMGPKSHVTVKLRHKVVDMNALV